MHVEITARGIANRREPDGAHTDHLAISLSLVIENHLPLFTATLLSVMSNRHWYVGFEVSGVRGGHVIGGPSRANSFCA